MSVLADFLPTTERESVMNLLLLDANSIINRAFYGIRPLTTKDGTFTNTERRVQRVRKVVPAKGQCRDDWWILMQLMNRILQDPNGAALAERIRNAIQK